jgi:hypothetical protein
LISFSTPETHPLLAHLTGNNFYNPWPESFIKEKAKELLEKKGRAA